MNTRILAAMLLASGLPSAALAHVRLTAATPAVGSTVAAAPAEVAISFSEEIEPRFSMIEVDNAAGNRVDLKEVRVAPGDGKRLAVGVQPLKPGIYKVVWHATSVDTHKTEGAFSFTVLP